MCYSRHAASRAIEFVRECIEYTAATPWHDYCYSKVVGRDGEREGTHFLIPPDYLGSIGEGWLGPPDTLGKANEIAFEEDFDGRAVERVGQYRCGMPIYALITYEASELDDPAEYWAELAYLVECLDALFDYPAICEQVYIDLVHERFEEHLNSWLRDELIEKVAKTFSPAPEFDLDDGEIWKVVDEWVWDHMFGCENVDDLSINYLDVGSLAEKFEVRVEVSAIAAEEIHRLRDRLAYSLSPGAERADLRDVVSAIDVLLDSATSHHLRLRE